MEVLIVILLIVCILSVWIIPFKIIIESRFFEARLKQIEDKIDKHNSI
tara:strand:- start:647 stop:790 length:144 start_codon:yes stop_codon:yes gene_type:complete